MRVILDTNVLVSGIFFSVPPFRILNACRNNKLQLVMSTDILAEYQRVAVVLGGKYPQIDLHPILDLLTVNSDIVAAPLLANPVCDDPDDDKFIACALASQTPLIVSDDKHLLDVDGYQGIQVLKPRPFVNSYLTT